MGVDFTWKPVGESKEDWQGRVPIRFLFQKLILDFMKNRLNLGENGS